MLYVRFPLTLRNVEDFLHERGIEISHETVRFWWNRFGPPHVIVTDLLRSYGAAMKVIGNADKQETGRRSNNRVENSHLSFRRRERAMLRFRRMRSLQKFVSVHASVCNHFNQERHLYSRENFKLNRTAALAEWRLPCSA
ncbi:DDE-type integrase/transposase/recombinase [Parasedimentitalea psychrophila]|uniref:DDE-type integrase/transposase/recombinase n=1 Tax=Parasedimentitalea psychrophila TaxID=2997337 RepID=A0A9Y2P528_9RHOB|nr:DDE-type integrase/transposase/recombinase [Parasedimentitalea psychrophila]WIY27527.1 DDE-type integrase/transposase/recombinase [Parasedimentitalea psychrophila]